MTKRKEIEKHGWEVSPALQNKIVVLFVTIVSMIALFIPLVQIASFDLRIADAFNTDEVEFMHPVMNAFNRGDFDIGRSDYGLFYYNIGLLFLYFLDLFIPVTEQVGLLVLRLVSVAFLLANSMVIRAFAKTIFGTNGNLAFVISLLGSTTLLNYGTMVHPDIAQVFLVSSGMYFIAEYYRTKKFKYAAMATVMAGLAFATKFVGIALLPLVIIYIWYKPAGFLKTVNKRFQLRVLLILSATVAFFAHPSWVKPYLVGNAEIIADVIFLFQALHWVSIAISISTLILFVIPISPIWNKLKRPVVSLIQSYVLGYVFCFSFCMGSPQAVRGFSFLNGLIYVTGLHKDGHWFKDDSGLLGWVSILIEPTVVHWTFALLALIGITFVLKNQFKQKSVPLLSSEIVPLWWFLVFCLVVVFRVKSHFAHYLIPIVPVVLLYCVIGIHELKQQIYRSFLKNVNYRIVDLGILLAIGAIAFSHSYDYQSERTNKYENSPELAAGIWLENNITEPVSITTDKYVYIPNRSNFLYSSYWGLTLDVIRDNDPDIIVINDHIYDRFMKIEDAETYLYGKELYLERNTLYNQLIEDKHKDYVLMSDFDDVKVYKKRPPNGDLK